MTTREILVEARKLVAKGWTRWAYARTKAGKVVSFKDKNACRWCVTGAVWNVPARRIEHYRAFRALERSQDGLVGGNIGYNDSLPSKVAALAWMDRAIARLK